MFIGGRPWCLPPVAGLDSPVTPPTFDVFYRLQVTNYGVFYVLFDSPPSGSNPIDIWDLYLHAQMAFPRLFRSNGFSDESPAGASRKSCFDSVRDLTRTNRSPLLLHEPDNVIETHEDAGDFKDRWRARHRSGDSMTADFTEAFFISVMLQPNRSQVCIHESQLP
jgi:hypothetical protein